MPYDYHFKCLNASDYELELFFKADNKTFNFIWQKARQRLARQGEKAPPSDYNSVDKFEVDPKYYNFVNINIGKEMKKFYSKMSEDNIILLNHNVTYIDFERYGDKKEWKIKIKVEGSYLDKR